MIKLKIKFNGEALWLEWVGFNPDRCKLLVNRDGETIEIDPSQVEEERIENFRLTNP